MEGRCLLFLGEYQDLHSLLGSNTGARSEPRGVIAALLEYDLAYPFGRDLRIAERRKRRESEKSFHWSGAALDGRQRLGLSRRLSARAQVEHVPGVEIEALEPRFLLSADLLPVSVDLDPLGSDLVLQFDPGDGVDPSVLQLLDRENEMAIVATIDPAEVGDITLQGGDADTTLTVDMIVPFPFDNAIHFEGGAGQDILAGPSVDTVWTVTGDDAGSVAGVSFSGVETLQGAADNQDTFIVAEGASLSGLVDGGDGGYDVLEASGNAMTSTPTGPQSGLVTVDGTVIEYAGLEPVVLSGTGPITLNGTDIFDPTSVFPIGDNILLEVDPLGTGQLVFGPALGGLPFEMTVFSADVSSITINLGAGVDTITIGDLGDFDGALIINGEGTAIPSLDDAVGGSTDTVIFTSDLALDGANLTVDAEIITLESGVGLSTQGTASEAGDISFDGEVITLQTGSGLYADGINGFGGGDVSLVANDEGNVLDLLVFKKITAGALITLTDADIFGDTITLEANAKSVLGGDPTALESLASKVFDVLPLTASESPIIFSDSTIEASVDIQGASQISASGDVTIATDTDVKSSVATLMLREDFEAASAVLNLIDADSTVTLGDTSTIDSDGLVSMSAVLDNEITTLATGKTDGFSLEIAIAGVDAYAAAIVESGAVVSAGASIDVLAEIINTLSTTAKPIEFSTDAQGADFAFSQLVSNAVAAIDGTATAGGSVSVMASSTTEDVVGAASDPANLRSEILAVKEKFSETKKTSEKAPFDVSGALTVVENITSAEARIGNGASVKAGGDITVDAFNTAKVQYTATSEVENVETGLNAALVFGDVTVKAHAYVGDTAVVSAGGNLVVEADAIAPKQDGLGQIFSLFDGQTLLESLYDVAIGLNDLETFISGLLFTTYARSAVDASDDGFGITGSSVDFTVNMDVMAYIGAAATVTATDITLDASSHIDTVNMTGVTDFEFVIVPNPVGGTSGKVTSGASLSFMNYNVGVFAFIDDAANVTASGVLDIRAESTENIFMLTESGGAGDSFGLNGASSNFNRNSVVAAYIDDAATVSAGGDITIEADDHVKALIMSGGVVKGASVGVGLSVALVDIMGITRAFIGDAEAQDEIFSGSTPLVPVAGQVSSGGSIRLDAASGAPIESAGVVPVANPNEISAYAVAGATGAGDSGSAEGGAESGKGKFGLNISGDVAFNTIGGDTSAFLNGSAVLLPALAVQVHAFSDSFIRAISGSAVYTGGSNSSGIAGSYSQNTITTKTRAFIDGVTIEDTTGFAVIDVAAETQGGIFAISAGGTSAGKIGIAGSVSNNTLDGVTEAFVSGLDMDRANLRIQASDGFDLDDAGSFDGNLDSNDGRGIFAVAGATTLGGKAGVGSGVAINEISNETRAYAQDLVIGSLNTVDILSVTDNDIESYAAALAAGATNALSGAVTYNTIESVTQAMIVGSSLGLIAPALSGVGVVAVDASKIRTGAGGIGASAGGTIGFGASATYNKLASTVEAKIENSNVASDTDVVVVADGDRDIETVAIAGSGGGTAGVSGAIVINDMDNVARAAINGGAVMADGNIDVTAAHNNDLLAFAVGGSQGSTIGLSGGVVWNTSDNITEASIGAFEGVGAVVDALGNQPARSVASLDDAFGLEDLSGLSLTALNTGDVTITSVNLGAAGTFGVALSGNTTIMRDQTRAYVADASEINQASGADADQSATIRAGNQLNMLSVGGGFGGGSTGGVGIAADTIILRTKTDAYVDGSSTLSAAGDIDVAALSAQTIDDVVAGGGGGVTFGVAGSVSVGIFESEVTARIGDADVLAGGDLRVAADQSADLLQVAGSLGGGGTLGFGGSVAVSTIANKTTAEIGGDATTNAAGATDVAATSSELFDTVAATIGGGGTAGLGASVIVKVSEAETLAQIGAGAEVNQLTSGAGQSVSVTAEDTVDMLSVAGALAGGGTVAFGASTDVQILRNKTLAQVGDGALVSATDSISVDASADQLVDSYVISGAGAGTIGLAGAVSVIAIGSAVDQAAITDTDSSASTQSGVDGILADTSQADALGSSSNDDIAAFTDASRDDGTAETSGLNVSSDVEASGAAVLGNTDAIVGAGAVLSTNGDLTVSSDNLIDLDVVPVGGGFAGTVGVAGAVGVTNIATSAQALINDGAILDVAGNIDVLADTDEILTTVSAAGVVGGVASIGGSVLVTTVDTVTQARLGNGVQIGKDVNGAAGNLSVLATNDTSLTAVAGQVGIGGTVGLGGASNTILFGKTTNTLIGASSDIDVTGDVTLSATTLDDINAVTISGGGAGVAAVFLMAGVNVIDNTTQAIIDDGAIISAGNNVLVDAVHDTDLTSIVGAASIGGTVGLGGGAGVSTFTSTTSARIDDGARVTAMAPVAAPDSVAGVSLNAASSLDLTADTFGVAFGGVAGVGAAVTTNFMGVDTSATIGSGANVTGNDVLLAASNRADVFGGAQSLGGGTVGIGGAVDTETFENTVTTSIDNAIVLAARRVALAAENSETLDTLTGTIAGGVAGLGGAVTVANLKSTTSSFVTANAVLGGTGDLDLWARSDATTNQLAGQVGVGVVALGAGVATLSDTSVTQAYVENSDIDLGGAVTVEADSNRDFTSVGLAGGAGIATINGAVSTISDSSITQAELRAGTTVDSASELNIEAASSSDYASRTSLASLSVASLGAAVTSITSDAETSAFVADQVAIGQTSAIGDMTVSALSDLTADVDAIALAGGVITIDATVSSLSLDPTTTARIDSADITATGDVTVQAEGTANGDVTLKSGALAGIAVNASVAVTNVTPTVSASIGTGSKVTANDLNVLATGDATGASDTTTASIAGVALEGSVALATVDPRVVAVLESGLGADQSAVTLGGDLEIRAAGAGDAAAKSDASSYSFAGIGASVATATLDADIDATLAVNASVVAAGTTSVRALMNVDPDSRNTIGNKARADAISAAAGLVGGVAGSVATTNTSIDVDATVENSSEVMANDILVEAHGFTDVENLFSGASADGVIASASASVSNAAINNTTSATVEDSATLNADNDLTVGARAITYGNVNALGGGQGSKSDGEYQGGSSVGLPSLIEGGGAVVSGSVNSTATVDIGSDVVLTAGETLALLAKNIIDVDFRASMDQKELGFSNLNLNVIGGAIASSAMTLDGDAIVRIGDRTVIAANIVNIDAANEILATSKSRAVGVGLLSSFAFSDATLNGADTIEAKIDLGDSVKMTADLAMTLSAINDGLDETLIAESFAKYDNVTLGFANAVVNGTLNVDARVTSDGNLELNTNDLLVAADSIMGLQRFAEVEADGGLSKLVDVLVKVTDEVKRTVCKWLPWPLDKICKVVTDTVVRWITKTVEVFENSTTFSSQNGGGFSEDAVIDLNGEISNFNTQPRFLNIDADGNIDPTSNIGATIQGNQILVDDIVNDVSPSFSFFAPDGAIIGNALINVNGTIPRIDIRNASDFDLVMGDIVMVSDTELTGDDFDLSFVSLIEGQEYDFAPTIAETDLLIQNTGAGDIIFSESFENVSAFMDIENTGGSILTASPDVTITAGDVGHLSLEAAGSIGTAADVFDIELVRGQVLPDGDAGDMPAELLIVADTAHIGLVGVNTTQAAFDPAQTVDGITLTAATAGDFNLTVGDSLIRDIDGVDWEASGTYTVMSVTSATGDVTIDAAPGASETSIDFGLIPGWMGWEETNQALIGGGVIGTLSAAGTARIDVTGAIRDRDGDLATEIFANRIELVSASVGDAGNALETDALEAFAATTTGAITLTETAGDLVLDSVESSSELVYLTALDGNIGGVSASADLTAINAYLQASGEIGSSADPLQTIVGTLDASALGGGITVVNDGALILGNLAGTSGITANGDIDITALSPLTVATNVTGVDIALTAADTPAADDFVRIAPNVQIIAFGDVTLTAGDAIEMLSQSVIDADGNVTLVAGTDISLTDGAEINSGSDVSLSATDLILVEDDTRLNASGMVAIALTDGDSDPATGGTIVLGGVINASQTKVSGANGPDTIAIRAVTAGTPMVVEAGLGDDLIRVGTNADGISNTEGTLSRIEALLTIDGGGENGVLDVDSTGLANATGVLTSTLLTGLDMAGSIAYGGVATLNVTLGEEDDTFTIGSTHIGQTNLQTAGGGDNVFVEAIAGQTNILTGAEDDTIFVGLTASPSQIEGIAAELNIDSGTGADVLTLDDSGETASELGTITSADVTGFGMTGSVNYVAVETLEIDLGAGDDRVNVQSTIAVTNLTTGAGGDLIFVSSGADLGQLDTYVGPAGDLAALHDAMLHGSLDGVAGALNIDAGTGSNTLSVSDRTDADADANIVVTDTAITGLAPASLTYAATGGDFSGQGALTTASDTGLFGRGINIYTGLAGDTVTIDSVATGGSGEEFDQVMTTVFLGQGNDAATANIADGHLVIRGETGDDTLNGAASTTPLILFGDDGADEITGGSADDLILGDGGRATYLAPTGATGFNITLGGAPVVDYSADARDADYQSLDVVEGFSDSGDDVDLIRGLAGDDVIFGGGAGDSIDGGNNRDLVFGDGASLSRLDGIDDNLDPRFRSLIGAQLYGAGLNGGAEGEALVDIPTNLDAEGLAGWSDWTIDVRHSIGADGDDVIAGGAASDKLFGGLGNDMMRGDGALDSFGALTTASGAGDDYVEGNGGNDTLWGDLGQDDLIGGSSSLYGLDASERSDGADLIFGGTGDAVERGDTGDLTATGHATDSDMILGDNGNIYRIGAASAGGFSLAEFAYDQSSAFEDRGGERIVVRAAELLDYTPGGVSGDALVTTDHGAGDEIHGEAGDDFLYGMTGSDTLFGEGQDDDIIGGRGHDVIYGGAGNDGVLGDDGRIFTSRNGTAEALYGITPGGLDVEISVPGNMLDATLNVTGALKKTVDLTPFDPLREVTPGTTLDLPIEADDVIFGGLGDDSLHGGHGDDAISGAEAATSVYGLLANPGNLLQLGLSGSGDFPGFDPFDPLVRIDGFFLNPDDATPDGQDVIFGDTGNDWLFGGTDRDHLYGGFGDDLLDADDDKSTNNGNNNRTDNGSTYGDIAFGGAGRDILIANNRDDRLVDWVGEFNAFEAPRAISNGNTFLRSPSPAIMEFLYDLSESDGADQTRILDGGDPARNGEPWGELGLVGPQDADLWVDQTGGPSDALLGDTATAMVAAQPASSNGDATVVTDANAALVFDEAVARFATHTGLSPDLSGVELRIADLGGETLARSEGEVIWIDDDAAGHGWFIDQTPETDEEYTTDPDGSLRAIADSDAQNQIDLLSVLAHEIGHIAGLDHADDDNDLMAVSLATGLRLVPGATGDTTLQKPAIGLVYNESIGEFVSPSDDAALLTMGLNGKGPDGTHSGKGKGKVDWAATLSEASV